MRIYPVLVLTEGSSLVPDQWHELQRGVLCKLYSKQHQGKAYTDYFNIIESLSDMSSDTEQPAAERIDNCLAEITCAAGLCLITLRNALDA